MFEPLVSLHSLAAHDWAFGFIAQCSSTWLSRWVHYTV